MATLRCTSSSAVVRANRTSAKPVAVSRRLAVTVQAVQQDAPSMNRREALMGAAVALSLVASASPAQAFLGFGDDSKIQENYNTETAKILTAVKAVIDLDKDDPSKEDRVKALRTEINTWVAKYRREPKVSGRPSYGNTYSVLNALAGHYNSFGATAPIPKKRLERVLKELDDATLFLSRGR